MINTAWTSGRLLTRSRPFSSPRAKTGSAQSVAVYGFIGDDGDRNQIVVIGISCGRIQDMVITDAVLLKVPLVNAGRHYRLIRDLHNSFCFAPVCEGLLDTNAEGAFHPDADPHRGYCRPDR